jgi:hypothetical protein
LGRVEVKGAINDPDGEHPRRFEDRRKRNLLWSLAGLSFAINGGWLIQVSNCGFAKAKICDLLVTGMFCL